MSGFDQPIETPNEGQAPLMNASVHDDHPQPTSTGRRGWVGVDRRWLADDRLSDSALRLMLWLDSHTDEFLAAMNVSRTAEALGWKRDRVRRHLTALSDLGLITVGQEARKYGGTVTRLTLHLDVWTDGPRQASEPENRWPTAGQRGGLQQASAVAYGEARSTSTTNSRTALTERDAPSQAMTPLDDVDAFEQFWAAYRRTGPKKVALRSWRAACRKAPPETILAGLQAWMTYWDQPGASAVKWPQGWLSEERWNDAPPSSRTSAPSTRHSRSRNVLDALEQNGRANEEMREIG